MSLRDDFQFYSPIRELANTFTFIFYVFSIIYYLNCQAATAERRAGEPGPYGLRGERRAADDRPYSGRPMTAPTAGGKRRGVEDAAPYGKYLPFLSLRDQSADWSWQSVPIFNVFKWQFENTTIFTFQFSIFISQVRGTPGPCHV